MSLRISSIALHKWDNYANIGKKFDSDRDFPDLITKIHAIAMVTNGHNTAIK